MIPGKEYKLAIELAKKPIATEKGRKITETILVYTDDDDPNLQELSIRATLMCRGTGPKKNKSPSSSNLNGSKEPTKNNPAPDATTGSG